MQFHFRLVPVDEITPWGTESRSLSWFALTLGWFWIEIDDQELFRYSHQTEEHRATRKQVYSVTELPYEDYQVARYWEDLVEMVRAILDPIPPELAARLMPLSEWQEWLTRVHRWIENQSDDLSCELYATATDWWCKRTWDASHLISPPHLWLWRTDNTIHIQWDNRSVLMDGCPVWESASGAVTLPVSDFTAAVRSFDHRFLEAMNDRIRAIRSGAVKPQCEAGLESLESAQEYRSSLLDNALSPWVQQVARGYSWDAVQNAIARIDRKI